MAPPVEGRKEDVAASVAPVPPVKGREEVSMEVAMVVVGRAAAARAVVPMAEAEVLKVAHAQRQARSEAKARTNLCRDLRREKGLQAGRASPRADWPRSRGRSCWSGHCHHTAPRRRGERQRRW